MTLWLLLVLSESHGCMEGHRVRHLPGADLTESNASHFSGYLEVSSHHADLNIFYYYTKHNDATAPLLVWMNGGPGASSLMGLFTELGPLLLNSRSLPANNADGKWNLLQNPYSWSSNASLLVWEQPAGVGFSRCKPDPCTQPWNDTSSAEANLEFLLEFYRAFPSELRREVYISGESYGGVYVPLLAERVHKHNQIAATDAGSAPPIKLMGIAVGNGCVGWTQKGGCGLDAMDLLVTAMEQGAPGVSRSVLSRVRTDCEAGELVSGKQPTELSAACLVAMQGLLEELGEYNEYSRGSACGPDGSGNWGDGSGFSCGADTALRQYLASAEVQEALHVLPPGSGQSPLRWQWWDGDSPFYRITNPNVVPTYSALLAGGYEVVIYNGLRDTGVPSQGAERWITTIGNGTVSSPRRKWSSPSVGGAGGHYFNTSQVAGYTTTYANGIRFISIIGAGHLMPSERPASALTVINAVLANAELPLYSGPKCKRLWLGRGYGNFCTNGSTVS